MPNRGVHASDGTRPKSDGSTSATLIQLVKIRDEDACRRLLDLYVPSVYSWCRCSGMQAQDAADVVQEVFRAVFRGIDGFRHERPGDTFRGWATREN